MIKQITCYGDSGIICDFGDEVKKEINIKVIALFKILQQKIINQEIKGIKNCIPSYNKLIIFFDLTYTTSKKIISFVESIAKEQLNSFSESKQWMIPVCYDKEFGIDQQRVADYTKLSIDTILEKHLNTTFYIYMLGFAPGFPYMGDLENELYCPRLKTPRVKINRGSVIIAENFCAIYPYDSPGGWNILGNTPIELFNQDSSNPSLFSPGDTVKFYQISKDEHQKFSMKEFLQNAS